MLAKLLVSGLMIGSVYGLIALGYSIIYKASGIMNLAQGDFLTLGAYFGFTYTAILGLPPIATILSTMFTMFIVGLLIEKFVIRPILNRTVSTSSIILATSAISFILQNIVTMIWGSAPLYFPTFFKVSSVKIFGVTYQTESLFCIAISVVCMLALHLFMKKTSFGTAMRAAAMDPMAARKCGINVSLTAGVTWGIAGCIASIGGIVLGPIYGVFNTLGSNVSAKGFTGAVMGGYGNMYGAILGGGILGQLETLISGYLSSVYKNLIAYILLLVFLFIKPRGLLNEEAIKD
jgi:branched-chain amino acid transport system permease protein